MPNTVRKTLQSVENKRLTGINKPKKINKVKDARRLMANLIYLYQNGEITTEYIKTLTYVLIKFQELYKTEVLENIADRIKKLEKQNNNEKT